MLRHLSALGPRPRRAAGLSLSVGLGLAAAVMLLALAAGRPAQAGGGIDVFPGGSIQAAINASSPGSAVFIHAGVYTESLTLTKTVSLFGDSSATTLIQAAPGQRVITVSVAPPTVTFTISGLTFQGGDVDGGTVCPQNCGGGMLVLTGTTPPLLQNLVFRNNAAYLGGGLFAGTDLTVTGSLFTNNTAALEGGGLHLANSGVPLDYRLVLSNSQFISNTALHDGGGAFVFGTAIVTNGWFERNRATTGPARGGGLVSRILTMTATSFYTNYALSGGGGAYNTLYAEITGGVVQGNGASGSGGGLSLRGDAHLTGTQFISNATQGIGGGLYLEFGDDWSSVSGARFERNACTFGSCNGGALGTYNYFNLVVDATDFLTNTAKGSGGAIYTGASLTVTDSLLRANSCSLGGCRGGGLSAGNVTYLSGVSYLNNQSQSGGGGAFFPGPATIVDTLFQGNACLEVSCRGGGVLAENSLTLTNTQLISNTSVGAGGGVAHLGAGALRVVNSLFARNAAGAPGLGLWFASPDGGEVLHTTFANALATSGAAVAVESSRLGLTNTIVANYSIGISLTSGTAFEDYTLFFGVATPTAGGVSSGSHHPTGNPLFANPAADNYHLQAGSPAMDVGVDVGVTTDIDGDARPFNLIVDLGYDEFALVKLFLPLVLR